MNNKNIVIVGAGLSGCFIGILLSNKGHKVTILEKLSEKDVVKTNSNRSYNITFYKYAYEKFKELGLWEEIKPFVTEIKGSATYYSDNSRSSIHFEANKKSYYFAVSRSDMLNLLVKTLKKKSCKVQFSTIVEKINRKSKEITIQSFENKSRSKINFDLVVGADGVNSTIRNFLLEEKKSKISKIYQKYEYKQILIDKDSSRKLNLNINSTYTWSDKNFMLAFLPNKNGTFAGIVVYRDSNIISKSKILNTFNDLNKVGYMFDGLDKVTAGKFVTIHTSPWFYENCIAIMGDAAHGFNPFFGQGLSAGMGDAISLSRAIDNNFNLKSYQEERKKHMDALGEESKKGISRYLRGKRADEEAIYEKMEMVLHKLLPNFLAPSIFESVMLDPGNTLDYVEKRNKQRRILNLLGFGLFVRLISKFV